MWSIYITIALGTLAILWGLHVIYLLNLIAYLWWCKVDEKEFEYSETFIDKRLQKFEIFRDWKGFMDNV